MPGAARWTIVVTDSGPSVGPFALAAIAGVVIAKLVHGFSGGSSVVKNKSAADGPPIWLGGNATRRTSFIYIGRERLVRDEVLISLDRQT